jgi:hypothetical protein
LVSREHSGSTAACCCKQTASQGVGVFSFGLFLKVWVFAISVCFSRTGCHHLASFSQGLDVINLASFSEGLDVFRLGLLLKDWMFSIWVFSQGQGVYNLRLFLREGVFAI